MCSHKPSAKPSPSSARCQLSFCLACLSLICVTACSLPCSQAHVHHVHEHTHTHTHGHGHAAHADADAELSADATDALTSTLYASMQWVAESVSFAPQAGEDADHDDEHGVTWQTWTYAIAATAAAALASLSGVGLLLFKPTMLKRVLTDFLGLSVGSLLGTSFFLLIPETSELLTFEKKVSATMFCGIVFGIITEHVLQHHHHHHHEAYLEEDGTESTLGPNGRKNSDESKGGNGDRHRDLEVAPGHLTVRGNDPECHVCVVSEHCEKTATAEAMEMMRCEQMIATSGSADGRAGHVQISSRSSFDDDGDDDCVGSGGDDRGQDRGFSASAHGHASVPASASASASATRRSERTVSSNGTGSKGGHRGGNENDHGHGHSHRHMHVHAHAHGHGHGTGPDGHGSGHVSKRHVVMVVAISDMFHNFVDGVLIGATFMASHATGLTTTIAIVLHEIPQEFADFCVLKHSGMSTSMALLVNFLVSLSSMLGALMVLAIEEVHSIEGVTHYFLPFAAGLFIYLAVGPLLKEVTAIPEKNKRFRALVWIALGAGLMLGLSYLPLGEHSHGDDDAHDGH